MAWLGRGVTFAALVALIAASACATYHPRPGRHIARDAEGNYHRDGQEFHVGVFGGGAEDLVKGDARALEYARREQRLVFAGTLVYLSGFVAMLVGPFVAASLAPGSAREMAVWGTLGLGLGTSIVGIVVIQNGQIALVDAANVYNDDIDAAPPARPVGAATPGAQP